MKKKLVLSLFAMALATGTLRSQISLEQTYPSAGAFVLTPAGPIPQSFGAKLFYMVKLEVSGEKYVSVDLLAQSINFYNLNHSLYATMSYSNVLLMGTPPSIMEKVSCSLLYFSENLFDLDNQIEMMYTYSKTASNTAIAVTQIVNQDGSLLFTAMNEAPMIKPSYHNQYYPIYNTPLGTKMILSKTDGTAKVYSLGGTFSGAVGSNPIINVDDNAMTLSPNPAERGSAVKLEYDLPEGMKEAELKVFDGAGRVIKSYRIGADMHSILVEPGELSAGVYYYSILSGSIVIGTKKSVVVE
jgi:hypothetical protein